MQPIIAIYVLWLLWFLSWVAATLAGNRANRALNAVEIIAYSIIVIAAALLLFGVTPAPGWDVQYRLWMSPKGPLGWLDVGIAFAAFCFAWWATICRSLYSDGPVVRSGPYRLIRHPFYAGLIIASLATAAMLGRPSSLTGAVVLLIAFVSRIFVEEYKLRRTSTDYEAYTHSTPMFVPFLPMSQAPARTAKDASPALEKEPTPVDIPTSEPATLPLFEEPMAPVIAARETQGEDEELEALIGLEPAAKGPVQLSLLLDDARTTDLPERSTDHELPHGPSSPEIKQTSAV